MLILLQQLHRSWNYLESFAAGIVVMNPTNDIRCVGPVYVQRALRRGNDIPNRGFLFIGLLAGGPAAIWYSFVNISNFDLPFTNSRSTYLISFVFMMITAVVLAEICSALPISGSIYIWAAASAGPKYGRFFGFVVAWWCSTGWMTVLAIVCQVRH